MASLRKKDRSPFWFACYTLPDGRRTQRSTGTPDKRKALGLALKYEDASREAVAGRFIESRARRVSQTFTRLPMPKCCPIRPPAPF